MVLILDYQGDVYNQFKNSLHCGLLSCRQTLFGVVERGVCNAKEQQVIENVRKT